MRLHARLVALATFILVAVMVPAPLATAAAMSDERNPDASSYANEFGISLEEADKRLAQQTAAGQLNERLAAAASHWFAGIWIEHAPTFRVIVYSTRDHPSDLDAAADALALGPVVDVRPSRFTLADLGAEVDRLAKLSETDNLLSLSIDVRNNKVIVRAPSPEALQAKAASNRVSISDAVEIEQGQVVVTATVIYAGFGITQCTAGYGVKQTGGTTRGMSTAGHCNDSQKYSNTVLPFKGANTSYSSDVQWHTTGSETVTNRAVDGIAGGSTPLYRNISSKTYRSGQALNSYVCAWGIKNGYSCGYLVSNTALPDPTKVTHGQPTYMVLARSGIDMVDPGDSGGPVYAGEAAWGIIHGCISPDNECTDGDADALVYMASNYLEGGVGVGILTTP